MVIFDHYFCYDFFREEEGKLSSPKDYNSLLNAQFNTWKEEKCILMQGFLITLVFALLYSFRSLSISPHQRISISIKQRIHFTFNKVLVQKGHPKNFQDDALFLRIFIIIHLVVGGGVNPAKRGGRKKSKEKVKVRSPYLK